MKNNSLIYSVLSKCQELEKNLRVVHNQVTINHFRISAVKQNKMKNKKLKNLDGGQFYL